MAPTTAIEPPPIPGRTWDDIDHAIYEHRIRQHRSLRATGQAVGLDHSTVRDRLAKMMRKVTFPEVEEMRIEEGHRLDELADQNRQLVELALAGDAVTAARATGRPEDMLAAMAMIDLDAAQRGLREIHAIARTRHLLFGLNATANPADADFTMINQLAEAYLAGVNDASGS